MYFINFTLKQHTPLIHFQHAEEGASLRATEVKPKLDRFIAEYAGKNSIDIQNKWKITKNPSAFNYKLKIGEIKNPKKLFYSSSPNGKNDNDYKKTVNSKWAGATYINQTSYFANNSNLKSDRIENAEHVKLGIYSKTGINCSIICYDNEFEKILKMCLPLFFLFENFGSRQSKGFGSFTVASINNRPIEFDEKDLTKSYSTVYKLNKNYTEYNAALQNISTIYRLIRSGHGSREQGDYKKSLLFLYFVQNPNPIRWEKRAMKQKINSSPYSYKKYSDNQNHNINLKYKSPPCYDNTPNTDWKDQSDYKYAYIRALLGLNETFEFMTNDILDKDNRGRDISIKHKYVVKVVPSDPKIERYKSPITWKYINGNVYICCNEVKDVFSGVTFNFDLSLKKGNKIQEKRFFKTEGLLESIVVPNIFSLSDFLKFCFDPFPIQDFRFTKINQQL